MWEHQFDVGRERDLGAPFGFSTGQRDVQETKKFWLQSIKPKGKKQRVKVQN
jgi:hypothetical protein